MPVIPFENLPDDARLWIFAAERPLETAEGERLLAHVDAFLERWAAHGAPLISARDWRYDRFLFVGVDERASGASGCSIDALVHGMQALERDLGAALVDHAPVLYRENGGIARLSREDFARRVDAGAVGPETTVFNNTLTTVGEVRAGRWEVPARDSWHARAFF